MVRERVAVRRARVKNFILRGWWLGKGRLYKIELLGIEEVSG